MAETLTVEEVVRAARRCGGLVLDSRDQPWRSAADPVGARLLFRQVDGDGMYPAMLRLRDEGAGEIVVTCGAEIELLHTGGEARYRLHCVDRLRGRAFPLVLRGRP